jgi:hypothetical protein
MLRVKVAVVLFPFSPISYITGTQHNTSTEKAKGIWLCADHFSAQYRTKPLDPTSQRVAKS